MFENLDKSQYSQGYDPKFKEPATVAMMEVIEDAYIGGYKKGTICKLLCTEMGMSYVYAQNLAAKVWKNIMAKGKERENGLKERNMQRLEFIYAEAIKNGDLKNANTAVDLLNKMAQLYKEKVELSTEDFEFILGGE